MQSYFFIFIFIAFAFGVKNLMAKISVKDLTPTPRFLLEFYGFRSTLTPTLVRIVPHILQL